jgi:hypothetical protein
MNKILKRQKYTGPAEMSACLRHSLESNATSPPRLAIVLSSSLYRRSGKAKNDTVRALSKTQSPMGRLVSLTRRRSSGA